MTKGAFRVFVTAKNTGQVEFPKGAWVALHVNGPQGAAYGMWAWKPLAVGESSTVQLLAYNLVGGTGVSEAIDWASGRYTITLMLAADVASEGRKFATYNGWDMMTPCSPCTGCDVARLTTTIDVP